MDRGAWWATVHGITKELDTTERVTHTARKSTLPPVGLGVGVMGAAGGYTRELENRSNPGRVGKGHRHCSSPESIYA